MLIEKKLQTLISKNFKVHIYLTLSKSSLMADGKSIEWNPYVTNYMHSTNSAAEAVVHLLLGYPHLSLVNRWDYPHPNL